MTTLALNLSTYPSKWSARPWLHICWVEILLPIESPPSSKANSINPSAFLPKRNACMVEQEGIRDRIANTKKSMDVLDTHKSKTKSSIACIGMMMSILDFLSLCINMDSITTAITSADNPLPILSQFLMKVIRITNNTKWHAGLMKHTCTFPWSTGIATPSLRKSSIILLALPPILVMQPSQRKIFRSQSSTFSLWSMPSPQWEHLRMISSCTSPSGHPS